MAREAGHLDCLVMEMEAGSKRDLEPLEQDFLQQLPRMMSHNLISDQRTRPRSGQQRVLGAMVEPNRMGVVP